MSNWPSTKARRVLAALLKIGWEMKRKSGSHRTLSRPDWPWGLPWNSQFPSEPRP